MDRKRAPPLDGSEDSDGISDGGQEERDTERPITAATAMPQPPMDEKSSLVNCNNATAVDGVAGAHRMRGEYLMVDEEEHDNVNNDNDSRQLHQPISLSTSTARLVEADPITPARSTDESSEKCHISGPSVPMFGELVVENVVMDDEIHPETATPADVQIAATPVVPFEQPRGSPQLVHASPLETPVITIKAALKNKRIQCILIFMLMLIVLLALGTILTVDALKEHKNGSPSAESDAVGSTRETFVRDVLPDYTKRALQDPNSPQSLALTWLWQDEDFARSLPLFRRIQRFALASIFHASTFHAEDDKPASELWLDNNQHECDWYHNLASSIICQDDRYVILDIRNDRFSGTIAPEVGLLTNLALLDARSTLLPGIVPTTIGLLRSLAQLRLDGCGLRGTLPTELGNLAELVELRAATNNLISSIPTEYGLLTNLETLSLSFNQIEGSIPTFFASLTKLSGLYLDNNYVTGSIPTELQSMTALSALTIDTTLLTGTFPLCGMPNLKLYQVSCAVIECKCACQCAESFTGQNMESFVNNVLPPYSRAALSDPNSPQSLALTWLWRDENATSTLPQFRRIQRFALATIFFGATVFRNELEIRLSGWLTDDHECDWPQNSVSSLICRSDRVQTLYVYDENDEAVFGHIAPEIGLLSDLVHLDLSLTSLHGSIPTEIGLSTSLEQLGFQYTFMTGELPSELGNLQSLSSLKATDSLFSGTIPPELGLMTGLRQLDLRDCDFSGTIPSALGDLTALSSLLVGSNSLSGPVPSTVGQLTDLASLSFANNTLTGTIPSELESLTGLRTLLLQGTELVGPFPVCNLVDNGALQVYMVDCDRVACSCFCSCSDI